MDTYVWKFSCECNDKDCSLKIPDDDFDAVYKAARGLDCNLPMLIIICHPDCTWAKENTRVIASRGKANIVQVKEM